MLRTFLLVNTAAVQRACPLLRKRIHRGRTSSASMDTAYAAVPSAGAAGVSSEPVDTLCLATSSCACKFAPIKLKRRALTPHDVLIEMRFCGICHSDVHISRGDMAAVAGAVSYPIVPGHELAGVVTQVGSAVTRFAGGDHVGVGCLVDSCLSCDACLRGQEQNCSKGSTSTYNGRDKHGRAASFPVGSQTLGGYTTRMVVHERFAVSIPKSYPLECAGPVMCAGVTLYDPLVKYGAKPGMKVAIVGIGGLGQMGIRVAKAMGAHVTAISRGESKRSLATACGADAFVASSDARQMAAAKSTLDLVLNTIPTDHDYHAYTELTAPAGRHVVLGLNSALAASLIVDKLVCGFSRVKMSSIGGIRATQEVIDLCAKNDIRPAIRVIGAAEVNKAYEDLERGNDDGLRHVIDIASLTDAAFAKCAEQPAPDFSKGSSSGITISGLLGTVGEMLFRLRWL
jgi:D-arabinose 1-dehydrogenase-like Zn-dependent alcohol dehydrogenase